MPLVTTATCDVCGAVRQETNHWFLVYQSIVGITISPFSFSRAEQSGYKIIVCGQGCLQKYISSTCEALFTIPSET